MKWIQQVDTDLLRLNAAARQGGYSIHGYSLHSKVKDDKGGVRQGGCIARPA